MTKYFIPTYVLFTFLEVDINETGHGRSRSIAILKNGKTIRKTRIMEPKNFFAENLQSTAIDFSISENETFWKL